MIFVSTLLFPGTPNSEIWEEFTYEALPKGNLREPWGKGHGDVDGDGLTDLILSGNLSKDLYWFKAPHWDKHQISSGFRFSTDHAVADIDSDGRNDIVSLTEDSLLLFRGPDWTLTVIDNVTLHDIEVSDLDLDGDLDIVGRNQSAFGGSGDTVVVYRNDGYNAWHTSTLNVPEGEGLAIADVNIDGYPDIVVNQIWLANPGPAYNRIWNLHTYTETWTWPHTSLSVGDIDGDTLPDIVVAPAEIEGGSYRISWFKAPTNVYGLWNEKIIDEPVESVHHFIEIGDMNMDGAPDIITAEMHQGTDPDEIKIYINGRKGEVWAKQLLGTDGSHSMQVFDFDDDGDLDIFGANWSGPHQQAGLWLNKHCGQNHSYWSRIVIDEDQLWTSLFVSAADINGNGLLDIISGAWWYQNPGDLAIKWVRHRFFHAPFNAALTIDIDNDTDVDILATRGEGSIASGELVWAINNGEGIFDLLESATSHGDFLQGISPLQSSMGVSIALSWHANPTGVQLLSYDTSSGGNSLNTIVAHEAAQHEAISGGDIDGDGDMDLVLGTKWLENIDGEFKIHTIFQHTENPDRNVIADVNLDGQPDVVVGYEAIDKLGKLAWYQHNGNPKLLWTEFLIAEIIGPMSVGAGDVDQDGDIDIVAGEHNLSSPNDARLIFFENTDDVGTSWKAHTIYKGDEHHDGAHLTDIDNDGDLDVISIGWSHNRVILYVNRLNQCSRRPREE